MTQPLRRIGLFPGSFNPPHRGHAIFARAALRAASLVCCWFYVNSINVEKRRWLISPSHRRCLLKLMLLGGGLGVLDGDFFPDDPGGRRLPQEQVFAPLIEKLKSAAATPAEVWLVRGSDNFRPVASGGYPYPGELRVFPHVIGLRQPEHRGYDYSMLHRAVFVNTPNYSSSDVRTRLRHGEPVARIIGRKAECYIRRRGLFDTNARI